MSVGRKPTFQTWVDTAKVTADITLGWKYVRPVQSVRKATMVSRIIRIWDAAQYVKEPNNVAASVGWCRCDLLMRKCKTIAIRSKFFGNFFF